MTPINVPDRPSEARTPLVTLEYRAFEDNPVAISFRHNPGHDLDDRALCEALFEQANTYQGPLFALLQPGLEATCDLGRRHTALSVGDRISIDDRTWECAPIGWERVDQPWERVTPSASTSRPPHPRTPRPPAASGHEPPLEGAHR